jgi:cytochrome o ubiquinol oxidase subunit III
MTDIALRSASAPPDHDHPDSAATAAFGFWVYIMSDCVLFAALFATFLVLQNNYAGGPTGKELFDLPYTLGETLLLLCSSMTYGFAVLAMPKASERQIIAWLLVTFLLGLGFVGMEINEFHRMILAGDGPDRSGFLSGFFALVATHGTHVTVGLVWMIVMMAQLATKGLTASVRSRLMRLSMFWHFLDIVWIGVFTVVYLNGVS